MTATIHRLALSLLVLELRFVRYAAGRALEVLGEKDG